MHVHARKVSWILVEHRTRACTLLLPSTRAGSKLSGVNHDCYYFETYLSVAGLLAAHLHGRKRSADARSPGRRDWRTAPCAETVRDPRGGSAARRHHARYSSGEREGSRRAGGPGSN